MTFSEYLISKKINEIAFEKAEKERFNEWKDLYEQIHPDSFTLQKKFLLNPTRRKYLLSS